MKKPVKILLWVVGILLALLVVASLLVSPIAKSYINNHGEELVGRKVNVEGLRVNLFTGHVAVHGLSLYEDNGSDVFASFDTLDVKASLLKMLASTLHIKHITLAGLKVNISQKGEVFNFQSIIDHFDTGEPKDTTPSDWVMKFYNIRISHAQIHYKEYSGTAVKQWHLPDINLRVPGFILGGEEASQGGLNIGFTEGGHLNIDGHYDAQKNDYSLTASLEDFAMKNIQPLTADLIRLDRIGGSLTAKVKAEGNINEIMKSRIGGRMSLHNLDLQNSGKQLAGLKQMEVVINNIDLDANSYDLRSVTLDGVTAVYEQWADHSTLDNLIVASASDTATAAPTADSNLAPLKLSLGTFAVTNSTVTYDNHSLPDEFHFPITNINIEAHDITLSGNNNAKLHATLPGGGHLVVNWKGNIDNWKQHQDLLLLVKGLDLRQLSPWTVAYTGQPVEDGIFSFTSRLSIRNSELDNQNKLDIFKAQVGSSRKDVEPEMKIPLKTALYILKDKNDKILIEVPVKGNIDNPEFSYMKVVWKTLGNLLVKVATSPVRALGNALGFGSSELDFLEITTDQRGLTSEQYHILGELATIAKSDSLMVLTLEQRMPAAPNDTIAHRYEFRNEIVRRYLIEQGVPEKQLNVITGEPVANGEKTGYAISSEIKLEE